MKVGVVSEGGLACSLQNTEPLSSISLVASFIENLLRHQDCASV